MTRLAFYPFLAMLVLVPLPFGSNRPWAWGILGLAMAVLLGLWILAALRDPDDALGVRMRRVPGAAAIFIGLIAWYLIQASGLTPALLDHPAWHDASAALGHSLDGAISLTPRETLAGVVRQCAYGAVFWLAMQYARNEARAETVLWTVAISGAAYAAYGLVVTLGGFDTILWFDRWAYNDAVTATFVNRNSFATFAGLALLASLALLLDTMHREGGAMMRIYNLRVLIETWTGRGGFLLLGVLVTASALLLSQSRGGLAATLFGVAVLLMSLTVSGSVRRRAAMVYAAVTVVVGGLVLGFSGGATYARLEGAGSALHERVEVARLTLAAALEAPLTGTGLGSFPAVFEAYRNERIPPHHIYDKAHNSYVELALEAGLPAAAATLALLAGLGGTCLSGLWRRRRNRIYPALGVAASALVGMHAMLDFSMQIPAVAVIYFCLLGVGCAQSWPSRGGSARRSLGQALKTPVELLE